MIRLKYGLSFIPHEQFYLDAWSDYGFALAHLVLQHADYAAHYKQRESVFLDNSFHELREPLTVPELLLAASIVEPKVLCAPDRIDDPGWTVDAAVHLAEAIPRGSMMGLVIVGATVPEMVKCWNSYRNFFSGFGVVFCLPYKCDRVGFLQAIYASGERLHTAPFWHLLGFHNVHELRQCAIYLALMNVEAANFDTAKPLNYAFNGLPFDPFLSASGKAPRPLYEEQLLQDTTYIRNVLSLKMAIAQTPWQELKDAAVRSISGNTPNI